MSSDDDDGVPVGRGRSRRASSLANRGRSRARTLDDSSSDEELFDDNTPTKKTDDDEEDLTYSADRMKAAVVRTGLQCVCFISSAARFISVLLIIFYS
jgi:hypothetical protein